MGGDDELAGGGDAGQLLHQELGGGGMEIQVDFVDEDDRVGDLLADKFVEDGKNGLFSGRHFGDIVLVMLGVFEKEISNIFCGGIEAGEALDTTEFTIGEDFLVEGFELTEVVGWIAQATTLVPVDQVLAQLADADFK